MDRRVVFLQTLKDIEERLQPGKTQYEVMKISGLLRLLLKDGVPSLDLLNRGRNMRLRFLVNSKPRGYEFGELQPVFWAMGDGFDPDTALLVDSIIEVNKNQLLACRVIYVSSTWYTVSDVIDQLAHIEGGVHMGDPNDDEDRQLTDASRFVRLGGMEANVYAIRSVARVVLKGLQPLRLRLEGELASDNPGPDILVPPKPKQQPSRRRRRLGDQPSCLPTW
jgi:hypothetical protein